MAASGIATLASEVKPLFGFPIGKAPPLGSTGESPSRKKRKRTKTKKKTR